MKFNIATAPRRDSRHWKQTTVTWDEIIGWMGSPSSRKDCGNYVLGTLQETTVTHPGETRPCTNTHRSKRSIASRDVATLDVDYPDPDFKDKAELLIPGTYLLHTTFSSSPDVPRYRLLIPLSRTVLPDEYVAVAEVIMRMLGHHQFDPGSTQPERYMFRPAAQEPGWFEWTHAPGVPMDPDTLLTAFEDDLRDKPLPKPGKGKRDPFGIEGPIGAFNRAYEDIQLLIDTYDLPYEAAGSDRWHLVGARSAAGMGKVDAGLVYSHHSNDPAYGKACTAFDLARLHLFGDLDADAEAGTPVNRLPSHIAMLDVARQDARVIAELVGVDFSAAMDDAIADHDSKAWRMTLRLKPRTGEFVDCIQNWDLVRAHEPVFAGLYYNDMAMSVETDRDLPWRPLSKGGPTFGSVDRSALAHYLEREFGVRPARFLVDELVNTTAQQRFVNPVKEYLESLEWDGKKRVETCLPGVVPTPYTRLVARKSIVAAVARMFNPGCKWDHTLVLLGSEGLGKSFWVDKMSKGWSASLGRVTDKDTLLIMQRSWIMLADEGHSLRKADADNLKEFLTRTEDVFRLPYERETGAHPRRCVIWSTTNDEIFLRRQEGNRRFLIVRCERKVDFDRFTEDYVDQVWAEAVHLYRNGERLFLEDDEAIEAAVERERFVEEDADLGILENYLDTLKPHDWDQKSPEQRREWLRDRADNLVVEGTVRTDYVCTAQLWVEAMGERYGSHTRMDLLDIFNAMKRMPGWRQSAEKHRLTHYGPQTTFERILDE